MGHALDYALLAIGLLVPAVIVAAVIAGPLTLAWLWVADRSTRRRYPD